MTSEDEAFCARAEFFAVEPAHADALHRGESVVGFHLDDVGVRVEVHVGRIDDLVPILGAEARRRTELPHLGPDDA